MARVKGIIGVPNPQIPNLYGDRDLPQGIHKKKGDKRGYIVKMGRGNHIGTFETLHEAIRARRKAEEDYRQKHNLKDPYEQFY